MRNQHLLLSAEKKELETILSEIPAENIIERMSFENRLTKVNAELAGIQCLDEQPEKAKITFRGMPVVGTHGIWAEFATGATKAFTDAFAAVTAGLEENLRYMGPIPNRSQNQLLITGTAIGSFGFELELPTRPQNPQGELFPIEDKAEQALEKIQNLFERAMNGTDDDLADIIDEIHPRAVRKVADFLEFLLQQQAWFGLEFKDHFLKYANLDQIQLSFDRLKAENIKETQETYQGTFQGVLPKGRTFEFLVNESKDVIKGKVGLDIEDPGEINRSFLEKSVNTAFSVVQVGDGRPQFTLQNLSDITVIPQGDI